MRRARLQPGLGVGLIDAAAELQPAGIRGQGLAGGGFIPRTELDDVTASQPVAPIQFGKPRRRFFRHKVCARPADVLQRTADDLLHLAFVKVNARSKHAARLRGRPGPGKLNLVRAGPASTDVVMKYDPLNRLTNRVDAAGTTAFSWLAGGLLFTEDGPWASDTVTNSYTRRLRTGLGLLQPQ